MPRPAAERPLRKVTLNLFDEDCTVMERSYGRGWSEIVRSLLEDHVRAITTPKQDRGPTFLDGDFDE